MQAIVPLSPGSRASAPMEKRFARRSIAHIRLSDVFLVWLFVRYCPLLITMQPAYAVEGRNLVTLRQSRIVEHGFGEVINNTAERHDGLADVDQLARVFPDDMNAQHLARIAMEDQ